jgi:hypothetical protein
LRALLSVSDREGIIELARALQEAGIECAATQETHAHLAEAGVQVALIPDLTAAEPADILVLDPAVDDTTGIGLLGQLRPTTSRSRRSAARPSTHRSFATSSGTWRSRPRPA